MFVPQHKTNVRVLKNNNLYVYITVPTESEISKYFNIKDKKLEEQYKNK